MLRVTLKHQITTLQPSYEKQEYQLVIEEHYCSPLITLGDLNVN